MPTNGHPMLQQRQLNDVDEDILAFMRERGRVTPQWIASETDHSRSYIAQRLKRLDEHDHVEKPHRGLYDLVNDPREGSDD